jgi:hypothetical protein
MLPPPTELTRELTERKWEAGEEILRQYPRKKECIVEVEKGRHIYKVVRDGMRIVRVHIRLRG